MRPIHLIMLATIAAISAVALAQEKRQPAPADQLLEQMLKPEKETKARPVQPVDRPPAQDRTSGPGAVAPDAQPMTVMREGSFIIDRVGRLTRTGDGRMEFSFEADGRSMQDPPVIILPNLKLMMMENAVAGHSRDLRFRITGVVTEYKGRNYVLLDKVVVVQDEERQM